MVEATEILRPILTPGIGLLNFYEYLMVLFLVLELGSSTEGLHLEEEEQVEVEVVQVVGCLQRLLQPRGRAHMTSLPTRTTIRYED